MNVIFYNLWIVNVIRVCLFKSKSLETTPFLFTLLFRSCNVILQCHLAMSPCNVTVQCHPTMSSCNVTVQCHPTMSSCNAIVQCHPAMSPCNVILQCQVHCHSRQSSFIRFLLFFSSPPSNSLSLLYNITAESLSFLNFDSHSLSASQPVSQPACSRSATRCTTIYNCSFINF